MAVLGTITREDLIGILSPAPALLTETIPTIEATDAPRPRRFGLQLSWLGLVGAAVVVATLNLPTLWRLSQRTAPLPTLAPLLAVSTTKLASVPEEAAPATPPAAPAPIVISNRLQVGALSVDAPVIWDSEYRSRTLLSNLRDGVVHLKGTARPGENGVSIITGHSSYYRWAAGSYKDVFAPLLQAQLGQEISVWRGEQEYRYKISQIYEVAPARTDLLTPGNKPLLRLITCTPLGSSARRLIVDAEQISPNPATNSAFTGPRLTAETILATR